MTDIEIAASITQGVIPIGAPKEYNYDLSVKTTAAESANQAKQSSDEAEKQAEEAKKEALKSASSATAAANSATLAEESWHKSQDVSDECIAEITGKVTEAKAEVQTTVNNCIDTIQQKADEGLASVQTAIDNVKTDIADTISNAKVDISGTVSGVKTDIANTVSEIKTDIADTISEAKTDITRTSEKAKADVSNDVLKAKEYALQAEDSATSAAAYKAPAYDSSKTYNYPDVVTHTDGFSYRCLGYNVIGEEPDFSAYWSRLVPVHHNFWGQDFLDYDVEGNLKVGNVDYEKMNHFGVRVVLNNDGTYTIPPLEFYTNKLKYNADGTVSPVPMYIYPGTSEDGSAVMASDEAIDLADELIADFESGSSETTEGAFSSDELDEILSDIT